MMYRYLLVGIAISITATTTYGQRRLIAQNVQLKATQEYNDRLYKSSAERMLGLNTYESIDGSPYYYTDPTEAYLVMQNDDAVLANILLDCYANELISVQDDGSYRILDPAFFESIIIAQGDEEIYFRKAHPEYPHHFFEVLVDGSEYVLLKKLEVNHLETSIIDEGRRENVNKFRRTEKYFLKSHASVQSVTLKKKKFFKAFPSKVSKELESLAKKNNLKLKAKEDFIGLFEMWSKSS